MKRYPEYSSYKPSGVEWLGKIPSHWEIKRSRFKFNIINGSTPKSAEESYWGGDIVWITPEDLGKNSNKNIFSGENNITKEGYLNCGTEIVPKGSIVLSTRAPIGHLSIAGVELCTNQGCKTLVKKRQDNPDYFYYLFFSFKPILNSLGKGTTFLELSKIDLQNLCIPVPPLPEQQAIAAFLDRHTAKIDALVAKYQRLIQLLQEKRAALITHTVTRGLDPNVQLKDSKFEWLGNIPAHWKLTRVKFGFKICLGKMLQTEQIFENESLEPYLRSANINWDGVDISDIQEMWFSPWEKNKYALRNGDLLICEGGDAGRSAIWYGQLKNCYIQNAVHRVREVSGFSNPFLYYWMYFLKNLGYIDLICSKATISHLTGIKLSDLPLVQIELKEQQAIAAFLDCQTAKIDDMVSKIESLIEKFQEYRSALITAAVTGKINVCHQVLEVAD